MLFELSARWFVAATLANFIIFPSSRRINIRSTLTDGFVPCAAKTCDPNARYPRLPEFDCNVKEHNFLNSKFAEFARYLNGGSFVTPDGGMPQEIPPRTLIRGLPKALMCPIGSGYNMDGMDFVHRSDAILHFAYVSDSTCFHFQLAGGHPVICGCLSNEVGNGTFASIVTGAVKEQLPSSCQVYLLPHAQLEHRPPPPRVYAKPGAKTLCAASWNVGREWDKLAEMGLGSGIGMEGLKGPELFDGIKTLLEECGDASIVALGIQEGADPMLSETLHSMTKDQPRGLIANAFAGVKPWGRNIKSVGEIPGLAEHEVFVVREGSLTVSGQTTQAILTSENLLIFKYDEKSGVISSAQPYALQLDTHELVVKGISKTWFQVSGLQFKEGDKTAVSCELIDRSLGVETEALRDEWVFAIRLQGIRARGEVVKEGTMLVHEEGSASKHSPHLVLLTTESLYAFVFDPKTGRPQNEGMQAIQMGNHEFHVVAEEDLCLKASGIHSFHSIHGVTALSQVAGYEKPLLFTLKMCAETVEERDLWILALRQASLTRAAWEIPRPYLIKRGFLQKIGQVLGMTKRRLVYLTNHRLLTYKFDPDVELPSGAPTNSLLLASITITREKDTCFTVSGMETLQSGKVGETVTYKMCGHSVEETDGWVEAIVMEATRANNAHTYDGYIENSDGPTGMPRTITLHLQVVGTLGNTSIEDVVTRGVMGSFPGVQEVQVVDVHEACRLVDSAFRPTWSVKLKLIGVALEPKHGLRDRLDKELHAIGFRIVDAEINLALLEESRDLINKMAFLPFTNGVSLAVLTDTPVTEIQLYTVDFAFASGKRKKSWMDQLKLGVRKMLPTTADKGGAIARVVIKDRAFCFAACHLDANNQKKRHQQAKLMSDSLAVIPCDAVVWMGDFNTRPQDCCPWDEIEMSVSHDLRRHVRNRMWKHDDFSEMVPGYQEMAPLYRPTFHKRFKRKGHDECAAKEFQQTMEPNPYLASLALHSSLFSNASVNDEDAFASAVLTANKHTLRRCGAPERHTLCWEGDVLRETCELGKCFNTVDKSHCPGYTDRIIYKGNVLSPLSYWPVESLVEADHTPVVATFQLNFE